MIEELAPKFGHDPSSIKTQVLGVRPGEKIHEALITSEEARYMRETDDMVIIHQPALAPHYPLVSMPISPRVINSEFSTLLTKEQIKNVLKKCNIL
jgi:FlaA1/EpsC-like NDP-sugar epimerase